MLAPEYSACIREPPRIGHKHGISSYFISFLSASLPAVRQGKHYGPDTIHSRYANHLRPIAAPVIGSL